MTIIPALIVNRLNHSAIPPLFNLLFFNILQVAENAKIGHEVGFIEPLERNRRQSLSNSTLLNDLQTSDIQLFESLTINAISKDILEASFDIDRRRGSLIITRPLDREQQSEYKFEIRALDTRTNNNPQSSAITVCIEVIDINDNPPIWPKDPLVIQVSESTTEGSVLYNFSATDADIGVNGQVQYRLLSCTPPPERLKNGQLSSPLFQVDILTGGLLLLQSLDYETIREYTLVVQAHDLPINETERLFSTITVRLQVLDENDNEPIFLIPPNIADSKTFYDFAILDPTNKPESNSRTSNVYINDNRRIGDKLTRVVATDRDAGNNGVIRYSIESGNEYGYFRLNTKTGHLELAKTLPTLNSIEYQQKTMTAAKELTAGTAMINEMMSNAHHKYELKIRAQDQGEEGFAKHSHLNLNIFVRNIKNNPPRFQQSVYYANVSENAASGTFVIQVVAKLPFADGDLGK